MNSDTSNAKAPATGSDAITAYLQHANEHCPTCDYELKGCPSDRCPECGETFVIRLGRRIGGLAWWWAALMGVALAAGPVVLYAVMRLYQITTLTSNEARLLLGPRADEMAVHAADFPNAFRFVILATLLGTALIWLINARAAWRLMSRRKQIVLGLLGAITPTIILTLLALIIIV